MVNMNNLNVVTDSYKSGPSCSKQIGSLRMSFIKDTLSLVVPIKSSIKKVGGAFAVQKFTFFGKKKAAILLEILKISTFC